jgi:hypothetical protein
MGHGRTRSKSKKNRLNYLKATPYEVGLLLNPSTGSGQRFGPKPEIKRKVYDNERKGGLSQRRKE